MAGMQPGNTPEEDIYGQWSKELTVTSGQKEVPEIKSVSITGYKEKLVKGKKIKGFWRDGKRNEPVQFKDTYVSTFKFKIVLKDKPKKAIGAEVFDKIYQIKGNVIEGSAKIVSEKSIKGKEEQLELRLVRNKDYMGYSPLAKKKMIKYK